MDFNAVGDWIWQSLVRLADIAPMAVFAAAVVAAIAIVQKARADRRSAWWDRLRWATDTALRDEEASRRVGIAAVKAVQSFRVVNAEDQPLLEAIGDKVLDREVKDLNVLGPIKADGGFDPDERVREKVGDQGGEVHDRAE